MKFLTTFVVFETFQKGMAFAVNQKEDLRLRMADLEKKLSESEDERRKLEKTCNVLIKAFKEEEKMRYKALNKKYEKFLEDCTVRKRRNDIILRSLCRIEDRSKVLFAKTERLKLLKDRYISYLKVNNGNDGSQTRKISDFTSGLIQRKSPLVTYHNREEPKDLFPAKGASPFEMTNHGRREEVDHLDGRMTERNGFGYLSHSEGFPKADAGDNSNFDDSNLRMRGRMTNAFLQQVRSGELGEGCQIKEENYVSEMLSKHQDLSEIGSMKGSVTGRNESIEKLKSLMSEEALDNRNCEARPDPYDIVEKDHIEQNEKEKKSLDELIPIMNHSLAVYSPTKGSHEEEKHQIDMESKEIAIKPESPVEEEEESPLPKGLDGVDYENETYPESYYEQPSHHNHASIASDVILEEDETEQEEADCLGGSWVRSPEQKVSEKQTNDDSYKGQEWDSEKNAKTEESDKAGKSSKSNLIQLLESDTESFQIEHGDAVSGNDDSDFEF